MNKLFFVPFSLIAMLLLAACAPVPVVKAFSQPNLENTLQAATAIDNLTISILTPFPTATETPTLTPTQTPSQYPTQLPTATPTQLPTATSTQTLAPTAVPIACNLAYFVKDITIPNGSVINPGETFTKTWRLQNIGACSWTSDYALVFSNGNLMNGPSVVQLPGNVNPGGKIDLSVSLTAPSSAGTYKGYWMLRDPYGNLFGVGSNGDQTFMVKIVVDNSAVFAVTEVDGSVNPASYSGVCPVTFTFDANIWTNGAGTVTFHWLRSDGSSSPEGTLVYTASEYQTVSEAWTLGNAGASMSGWDQIVIDQPAQQSFNPITFNLTCALSTPTATTAPTQTPMPTLTPTPTQPAPTQTPLPTFTPTPTQPAPTQTPTPTLTPTPTQPAPTQTPAPTLTPTPTQPAPTQTPLPTFTPTPTQPAPTQTPTPTQTLTLTQLPPTPTPTPSDPNGSG